MYQSPRKLPQKSLGKFGFRLTRPGLGRRGPSAPGVGPRRGKISSIILLTGAASQIYSLPNDLIRVAVRFFSGVPHPHLLGVCCPNQFFLFFVN